MMQGHLALPQLDVDDIRFVALRLYHLTPSQQVVGSVRVLVGQDVGLLRAGHDPHASVLPPAVCQRHPSSRHRATLESPVGSILMHRDETWVAGPLREHRGRPQDDVRTQNALDSVEDRWVVSQLPCPVVVALDLD